MTDPCNWPRRSVNYPAGFSAACEATPPYAHTHTNTSPRGGESHGCFATVKECGGKAQERDSVQDGLGKLPFRRGNSRDPWQTCMPCLRSVLLCKTADGFLGGKALAAGCFPSLLHTLPPCTLARIPCKRRLRVDHGEGLREADGTSVPFIERLWEPRRKDMHLSHSVAGDLRRVQKRGRGEKGTHGPWQSRPELHVP